MWNNSFGNPGNFQNFSPEAFQNMAFGGIPSQGQHYYPQQGMMQMNEHIDSDPMDEYQPALGFANQSAFTQNQNVRASFSSPMSMKGQATQPATAATVVSPRAPTQMNARAAELKAELLKRKGERTPPISTPGAAVKEAARPAELAASNKRNSIDDKHEQDLNELISQYSAPRAPASTTIKQEKKTTVPSIEQIPSGSAVPSQALDGQTAKPVNSSRPQTVERKARVLESRNTSRSVSEGEIFDDTQSRPSAATQVKDIKAREKVTKPEEPLPHTSREDHSVKPQYHRPREETRYSSPSTIQPTSTTNVRADRRDEADRMERRRTTSDSVGYQGNQRIEQERQIYPRRDSRDDDNPQKQNGGAAVRAEPHRTVRESKPPTLQDLLPLDEDLREWLEITGYHNEPYRNKILNRRRAIAALDAQRDKLLAEMAAEERGVPPAVVLQSTPSMLPPPTPNKVGSQVEPKSTTSASEPQHASNNKRPYSEVQEANDTPKTEKIARVEERAPPSRIKDEDVNGSRRPRSSGDSGRRYSPARHGSSEPRPRFEGRPRSRERELSPGRRAYDSRPPTRSRGYESENYFNRDDFNNRHSKDESWYHGKEYDPEYRGRGGGRGRGRGRGRGEFRDTRNYGDSDYKNDNPFGSRIASGRPYRDLNGYDRGGRGDTRYFIVKSFNEENVLKCIEDSVWTTQVQNGPVFKEAFETCKNVILVFSINKSRAFQGYARMESLPGSVAIPNWQKAINWESAGAFKVKWLVICSTRFHRVGHLKNPYNENLAVLIGKDGQEIEESVGAALVGLIDEEADSVLGRPSGRRIKSEERDWNEQY